MNPARGHISRQRSGLTVAGLLLVAACTLSGNGVDPQQRLTVAFPGSTQQLGCARPQWRMVETEMPLQCSVADGRLSCDGDHVEPFDVNVVDVCNEGRLPIERASVVEVRDVGSRQATIEWLSLKYGSPEQVIASRVISLNSRVEIPIADAEDRAIRVSRSASSPVTISAAHLLRSSVWDLPGVESGGEIVVILPALSVPPVAFNAKGSSNRELQQLEGRLAVIQGLATGEYEIIPKYGSDLVGTGFTVPVREGSSSILSMPRQSIGGVVISLDADICPKVTAIGVKRDVGGPLEGFISDGLVLQNPAVSDCKWKIEGLPIGNYVAYALTSGGSGGSGPFGVVGDAISTVQLGSRLIPVSGAVSMNRRPLPNANLTFISTDNGEVFNAITDSSGSYITTLSTIGRYNVLINSTLSGKQRKTTTVTSGQTTINFELSGGTIVLRLNGWTEASQAVIQITSTGFTTSELIQPGQPPKAERHGLDFGKYTVTAIEGNLRATRTPIVVEINEDRPQVEVDLNLENRQARLTIIDPFGQPMDVAFKGYFPTPTRLSPGTYSVDSISPGAQMRLIGPKSLTPTCIRAPFDDMQVVLTPGRYLDVTMANARQAITPSTATVQTLRQSDCELTLTDFDIIDVGTFGDSAGVHRILNFPVGDAVIRSRGRQYIVGAGDTSISLPR